jgi:HAD superfamily hydrolase (TIGR01509 family)
MALDALVFDLDGTLIDSNSTHVDGWVRAFERLGYKVLPDRIGPEIGKGGDNLVPSILGPEAEERDGEALREAAAEEYVRLAKSRRLRVFDGARALIEEAKRRGLKVALATSSSSEHLDATFGSAGEDLRPLMDAVIGASDVERSKPHPDVITAAVRKLGVEPAQCAMIGDTPYDAIAARRAGVVTLGVMSSGLAFSEATLVSAGARRLYRDVGHLRAELDDALRTASPGSAHFTRELAEGLMREALDVAREGMAAGEAPVGCVIADGSARVIARAYNEMIATQNKTAHAEIVAFARAAGKVPLEARDLILVSTLEPCVMCTGAAMEGAVDTIFYGLRAPADAGSGRVRPPESPESQMPRIVGDVLAEESRSLFEEWLAGHEDDPGAPYVRQLLERTEQVPEPA